MMAPCSEVAIRGKGFSLIRARILLLVWYGTSRTDGEGHQLLSVFRKLSKVYNVNRSGQQIAE